MNAKSLLTTTKLKPCVRFLGCATCPIDQYQKSQNAIFPYPTMHHFVTEMCACLYISVTKWCIVGHLSSVLWDLGDGSIVMIIYITSAFPIIFRKTLWYFVIGTRYTKCVCHIGSSQVTRRSSSRYVINNSKVWTHQRNTFTYFANYSMQLVLTAEKHQHIVRFNVLLKYLFKETKM